MRTSSLLVLGLILAAVTVTEARRRAKGQTSHFVDTKLKEAFLANKTVEGKEGRVFSLFNVVQFKNDECVSTSTISGGGSGSTRRNGTCFTQSECGDKGGTASGTCAAGFGVCCVFFVSESGSTVNQNCSYVRNPGYPSTYTDTSDVSYTVNKVDNTVCSLRLDFESFTLLGTGNTNEVTVAPDPVTAGGQCLDTFEVTNGNGPPIPVICGQNTGQHMYIDIGRDDSASSMLSFSFDSTRTGNRQWEIKVSQVPCSSYNAPAGCLQYHFGLTGRLSTFNFLPSNDNHLANHDYAICIRQEAGFCCIQYSVCPDANSMSLASKSGAAGAIAMKDCTAPFQVDIRTDAMTDVNDAATANTVQSRGTCLTWQQIPC